MNKDELARTVMLLLNLRHLCYWVGRQPKTPELNGLVEALVCRSMTNEYVC